MPTPQRDLDIVLFGATGFVGRLTAHHLANHAPAGVRIGLAGRSPSRLASVQHDLPARARDWELIVVDALDEEACAELAARTRVVVTTVGPYAKYGRALVSACAAAGTHYCDLTGEVLFAHDSIADNHETAVASGARIVHSCGFDSIPSDLGVMVLADAVRDAGEGTLTETLLHVRSLRGGVSGGTIDSMRGQAVEAGADPARRRIAADPYGLSSDRSGEPRVRRSAPSNPLAALTRRVPARRDEVTGRWVAPFFMASYNTRVVRRSNSLTDWSYGRELRYDEVMDTGRGPVGAAKAGLTTAVLGGLFAGMAFGPTRALLDKVLPEPGQGPSEHTMARGRFVIQVETTTTTGARFRSTVAADEDPGYTGTAIMLGESAIALALDADELPDRAGVLTPATGIGAPLVRRLRECGFTIEAERV